MTIFEHLCLSSQKTWEGGVGRRCGKAVQEGGVGRGYGKDTGKHSSAASLLLSPHSIQQTTVTAVGRDDKRARSGSRGHLNLQHPYSAVWVGVTLHSQEATSWVSSLGRLETLSIGKLCYPHSGPGSFQPRHQK